MPRALSDSPEAVRKRDPSSKGARRTSEWRQRKARGEWVVTFTLYADDFDGLVKLGQITEAIGARALSAAVADYLTGAIRADLRQQSTGCDASPVIGTEALPSRS